MCRPQAAGRDPRTSSGCLSFESYAIYRPGMTCSNPTGALLFLNLLLRRTVQLGEPVRDFDVQQDLVV